MFSKISLMLLALGANLVGQEIKQPDTDSIPVVYLQPVTIVAVKPMANQQFHTINSEQRLSHDAGSLLNQLPFFSSIRKSGTYGFDPVFRGFKFDQINIVIDGTLSATAACPNRMDPPISQVAPNMSSMIEIFKGPYALRYGTGFGATLNVVTVSPKRSESLDLSGRLSSGYQTNGELLQTEGNLTVTTNKSSLSTFLSIAEGNDYLSGNKTTIGADFSRKSLGFDYSFDLSTHQKLDAEITYNRARSVDFPAQAMDLITDDTYLFNVKQSLSFDSNQALSKIQNAIFGSFVDHTMSNELREGPKMADAITNANTENYGFRSELTFNYANTTKWYLGLDHHHEQSEGTRYRTLLKGPMQGKTLEDNVWQDGEINKSSIFSELKVNYNDLDIVMATRLEYNQSNANKPTEFFSNNYDIALNQLNSNFSLGVKNKFEEGSIALWLGKAQRSGSLTERFINSLPVGVDPYELIGNPELKSEVNNQIDLVLDLINEKRKFQVDIFGSRLDNYITSNIDESIAPKMASAPGVRKFINLDKAMKFGFEVDYSEVLSQSFNQQLSIAYTHAKDLTTHEPLPEIAPLDIRYRLNGNLLKGKVIPSLLFRKVGDQNRVSSEFGETKTPGFQTVDLSTVLHLSDQFEIQFELSNVFNENYYEHLSRSVSAIDSPLLSIGRNFITRAVYQF